MSEMLPTRQAQDITEGLLDYLTTMFALADDDARLALLEFLGDAENRLFKGPFLRLRLPFRPAASTGSANVAGLSRLELESRLRSVQAPSGGVRSAGVQQTPPAENGVRCRR